MSYSENDNRIRTIRLSWWSSSPERRRRTYRDQPHASKPTLNLILFSESFSSPNHKVTVPSTGFRQAQPISSGRRLEVMCEAPLKFICPNVLSESAPAPGDFQFQSKEFLNHVQLQISQGERILYRQNFPRVIVNEFMRLRGDWVGQVDFSGEALKAILVPQ